MFVRGMESEAPYPGLRSFRRHEVDIFFGRDDHIDEMIGKLAQTHFLCITGPSGCGKSSLARTGLMNGLESGFLPGTGSDWLFVDLRPGNDPLHALFETAAKAIVAESDEMGAGPADRASEIRHLLQNHVISSSHDLTAAFRTIPGLAGRPILILIDQFEELFRYAQKDAGAAMTFVDVLLQTIAAGKNIYVVITIRTDELEKCSRYPNLAVVINNSQFLTPMLDRFQIQEAIEGPITAFGGTIDNELTIWLLNSIEDEFDKLPLLQHTLKLLYQEKCTELQGETSPVAPAGPDRGARRPELTIGLRDFLSYFSFEPGLELTNPQSPAILRRSLSKRLDDIYLSLPGRLQAGAKRIFCALTSLETGRRDIRRPLRMAELESTTKLSREEVLEIIAAFSEGDTYLRIVKDAEDDAHDTVDVTHECVLRLWDRLCDQWLADERSSVENIKFLAHLAKNYDDEMHRSAVSGWLLSENVLRGGTLQHYWQWFTQVQPTASWATRYLSDFSWFDKSSGKPRSAESIFQQIVQFLAVCRRRQQVLRAFALTVAVLLIVAAGTYVRMIIDTNMRLERQNKITSAIVKVPSQKDEVQQNERTGGGTNRLCNDTTPFCAKIHAAQAARISIEELRKYGEYALCPADNLYRSVAPISSLASGECAGFPPVAAATPMKPNVDRDYETGYGIAKGIAVNPDGQAVARTLFTTIGKQNPYTPAVFRDLGETYLNDPTLPAQQRFSDGGACFRRALDLSCQNQQEVYDLYFSIYSLDDLFQEFQLTAPRIIGLLSLSRMLLGEGALSSPSKAQKHSVDQIQRLWRGAQPAADAARLIRKGHNCSPDLFKGPAPAADADPACAMVKSLYQRAAQAWGEMLTMAKAPDLDKDEQLQIIFGAGIAGLFWGQDSDFRNVAAGSIDVSQLAIWLEKGRQQREQPRYYSALAMLKCLEKDYDAAKKYASGIKSADAKYLDIQNEARTCDKSPDIATLFNRPTISE
jgi:energy-coupling factor transporter ATP-binding protein EcfA2